MTLVSDVGHYHNKTAKMWGCLYDRENGEVNPKVH